MAATKTSVAGSKAEPKKAVTKVAAKKSEAAASAKPAAAEKPAVRKATSTKNTTEKKPEKKQVSKAVAISDEQRYRMVAEAAYYRAESRQFKSDPIRDWIEAEKDISILLCGKA